MNDSEEETAEVVLPCPKLSASIDFLVERLGFRLVSIFPADDPEVAVLAGHGVRLRLDRSAPAAPTRIRLRHGSRSPSTLTEPSGNRFEWVPLEETVNVPPPRGAFSVTRFQDGSSWNEGRAGMLYRDLVADRLGGFLVASHIRIPEAGPVPDYVHFHRVRFQLIYCIRGSVRLIYEDQGDPFVLGPGDCVLQPPTIRHRVLESTGVLEVVELGVPARHETRTDPELNLPTPEVHPDRAFEGQRFVRDVADRASWEPWRLDGFECRTTRVSEATGGSADVRTVRRTDGTEAGWTSQERAWTFVFVLRSEMELSCGDRRVQLRENDAATVPPDTRFEVRASSSELEFLEVALDPEQWV